MHEQKAGCQTAHYLSIKWSSLFRQLSNTQGYVKSTKKKGSHDAGYVSKCEQQGKCHYIRSVKQTLGKLNQALSRIFFNLKYCEVYVLGEKNSM